MDLVVQDQYKRAQKKLQKSLLDKTDGCETTGTPDKNDSVSDCDAQAQLYPVIKETINLLQRLL